MTWLKNGTLVNLLAKKVKALKGKVSADEGIPLHSSRPRASGGILGRASRGRLSLMLGLKVLIEKYDETAAPWNRVECYVICGID
jgi:hypothetical protein